MSPDFPFVLDEEGFKRFDELLTGIGMRFAEQRRQTLAGSENNLNETTIYGELISQHGRFHCELTSSSRHYFFTVRVRGHAKRAVASLVGDLERAFAVHLTSRQSKRMAS